MTTVIEVPRLVLRVLSEKAGASWDKDGVTIVPTGDILNIEEGLNETFTQGVIALIVKHAANHGVVCETCGGSGIDDGAECGPCHGVGVGAQQAVVFLTKCGTGEVGKDE